MGGAIKPGIRAVVLAGVGVAAVGAVATAGARPFAATGGDAGLSPPPPAGAPDTALARYDLAGKPTWQVALPDLLAEISGLAVTPDGRLFAHGDEEATVHQLDARTGRLLKMFALDATAHRQPEGIAFAPDGTLLISNEGAGGKPTLSGYAPVSRSR